MRFISRAAFLKLIPVAAVATVACVGVAHSTKKTLLTRGINIGNALEAPRDTPWDVEIQLDFFDEIVAAGFETVRLPVRFSDYIGDAPNYTLDETFLQSIDTYINHALSLGLTLVLDCHHFTEIMDAPVHYAPALYAIWAQLAQRYHSQPNALVFELLNEPHGQLLPAIWNEMIPKALAAVRQYSPNRLVLVDAPLWGNAEGLSHLTLPKDDHLVASFHYYDPPEFTFQNNIYHPEYTNYVNIPWLGTDAELAAMRATFKTVADWGDAHSVPIFLGEFGANQAAPADSRQRWTKAVVQLAKELNFGWCYWELASHFGIYDADTQCWDDELLTCLLDG